jgi:hypothetical protein
VGGTAGVGAVGRGMESRLTVASAMAEGPSASGEVGERLKEKTRVKLCAPAQGPPQLFDGGGEGGSII